MIVHTLDKFWEEYDREYPAEEYPEIKDYWWRDCYQDIHKIIVKKIPLDKKTAILECGCGTGNSSLLLSEIVKSINLLDNSSYSLKCAKSLARYYRVNNVQFTKADAFNMPFGDNFFDFCWNVGLIEHFSEKNAEAIIAEMVRVTKNSGYICIGVPNFASLAIKKAGFLSLKYLKPLTFWMQGYRLADERNYRAYKLNDFLKKITKKHFVKFNNIQFNYAGSFLPVETPFFIYKTINKLFPKKLSFILLMTTQIIKQKGS